MNEFWWLEVTQESLHYHDLEDIGLHIKQWAFELQIGDVLKGELHGLFQSLQWQPVIVGLNACSS